MNVVLDSNIFRSDLLLKSKDIDVLIDYLGKTDSKIILPRIILDEIKGLYLRELNNRIAELNKIVNNINLALTNSETHINIVAIKSDEELAKYEKHILNRLKINEENILPYNNEFLPEIANRAIHRIKPCGDKGQGFRDTLIWLTIKEYCTEFSKKHIAFISLNTEDFANTDKNDLHEVLRAECDATDIKVYYFKSIREFIANHSSKIEFITYDWLAENMSYDLIGEMAKDFMYGKKSGELNYLLERQIESRQLSDYSISSVAPFATTEFFIYEMIDNTLHININVKAELEVQYDSYEEYWNDRYHYFDRFDRSDITYIEVEFYVTMIVKDKAVVDMDILDVYY